MTKFRIAISVVAATVAALVVLSIFAFRDRRSAIVEEIRALRAENAELEFALGQLDEHREIEVSTSILEVARALLEPRKTDRQKELISQIYGDEANQLFQEDQEWLDFEGRQKSEILRDDRDTTETNARSDAIYEIALILAPPDAGVSTNRDAYAYLCVKILNIPPPGEFEFPSSRYPELIHAIETVLSESASEAWKMQRTVPVRVKAPGGSERYRAIKQKIEGNKRRIGELAENLSSTQ